MCIDVYASERYATVVLDGDVVAAALERGLDGWIRGDVHQKLHGP